MKNRFLRSSPVPQLDVAGNQAQFERQSHRSGGSVAGVGRTSTRLANEPYATPPSPWFLCDAAPARRTFGTRTDLSTLPNEDAATERGQEPEIPPTGEPTAQFPGSALPSRFRKSVSTDEYDFAYGRRAARRRTIRFCA